MSFYEHSPAAPWPTVRRKLAPAGGAAPLPSIGPGEQQPQLGRWERAAFDFESLPQPVDRSEDTPNPPQETASEPVKGAFGSQLDEVAKAMDVLLKGAKPFRRYDLPQQQPYLAKRHTFPSAPRHEGFAKVGNGLGAGGGGGIHHVGIGAIGQKEDKKDEHWRTWQTGLSSARPAQGVWG